MKNKALSLLLSISACATVVSCSPSTPPPENSVSDAHEEVAVDYSDESITPLYDHISNDDYLDMLEEYNEIFMDALSIVSTNQVASLISENATIGEVVAEIDRVLAEIEVSSAELQEYYDTFDQNRSEAPMQTRIMTLLSDAQSALTQYKMAMEDLKLYSSTSNEDYMNGFLEYSQKAQDSISDYNSVLNEELSKLGAG